MEISLWTQVIGHGILVYQLDLEVDLEEVEQTKNNMWSLALFEQVWHSPEWSKFFLFFIDLPEIV